MPTLLTISGSPFPSSRTEGLALLVEGAVRSATDVRTDRIAVRDLPAEALLRADAADTRVAEALDAIARADAVLIASPVYKASYTGILKALLDLARPDVLAAAPVAAVLSGGDPAHGRAATASLAALVEALGARSSHPAVFALDTTLPRGETAGEITVTDPDIVAEVDALATWLARRLGDSGTRDGALA